MTAVPSPARSRYVVPAAGLLALAVGVLLYLYVPRAYFHVMAMMIRVPAPRAFTDWEWIPSAVRCWSEGVNVYLGNPCFPLEENQGYNYSPLWLRLSFLRYAEQWTNAASLAVCALFFLSLASLPAPRVRRDQVFVLLAALSCATLLGMERANADLLIFLMIIAALNLLGRSVAWRWLGYALVTLCGLLKFYPFVAMMVALRERRSVFLAVAAVSVAALAALVLAWHAELRVMLSNLPVPSYFKLQFGAADLAAGLGVTVGKFLEKGLHRDLDAARAMGGLVTRIALPVLALAAVAGAAALARTLRLPAAQARLSRRETDFLVVGAALICGCFFAGQSVIYRGIFLLLALPGLAALSHDLPTRGGRRLLGGTCALIVFVLWTPFLDACLLAVGLTVKIEYQGNPYDWFPNMPAGYLLWLASELAWWWIVAVLLAVLGSFVLATQMGAWLGRMVRMPAAPAHGPG